MLESLTLRNFQAHRKTVLRFGPAATTIVGESDEGKSAILRALRWVCLNIPAGDAFKRHGKNFVSVRLLVDGNLIRRRRGSSNLYTLNDQKYHAFGNAVPAPVVDVLNVSQINFQGQHDPPFWLSDSAGQVSRKLNTIINLGVIDRSLGYVAAELRRATGAVDLSRGRLKSARETAETLNWVPEFARDVRRLEKQAVELEKQRATIDSAALLLREVQSAELTAANAAPAATDGRTVLDLGERMADSIRYRQKLQKLLDDVDSAGEQVWHTQEKLEAAKTRLKKLAGANCPLCGSPRTTNESLP